MQKKDYLEIFKEAWLITWKNKFLWILGALIFIGSVILVPMNSDKISSEDVANLPELQLVIDFSYQHQTLVVIVSVVLAVLGLMLCIFGIIAQAGLIKAVNNIELYKQIGISGTLREGRKYFWKIFMLKILINVATLSLIGIMSFPVAVLIYLKATLASLFVGTLAVAIIFPLLLLLYFVFHFTILFLILTEQSIKISTTKAYELFLKKNKECLLFFSWMLAIMLVLVLLMFVVILFVFVFGKALFALLMHDATFSLLLLAMVSLVLTLFVFSVFEVFRWASWVLFLKKINGESIRDEEKRDLEKARRLVSDLETV